MLLNTGTDSSRTKALMANYRRCTTKEHHENVKFIMTSDVSKWYFLMGVMPGVSSGPTGEFSGEEDEFIGGQYLGVISATKKYPFGPPDVIMLTPNGVFPVNDPNFCISIGKYHATDYPSTLGMDGFTKTVCSGLQGWKSLGPGLKLTKYSSQGEQLKSVRKLSLDSQEYNRKHNSEVLALFQNQYVSDGKVTTVTAKPSREERVSRSKKDSASSEATV